MTETTEPITIWAPTSIRQTTAERFKELIRGGGARWKREHDPEWRGKPWMDGILVDLDEDDVLETILNYVLEHINPKEPA